MTTDWTNHPQPRSSDGDVVKKILVCLVIFGLLVFIVLALGIAWLLIEKPTLDVRLKYPETVVVGESFELVLETKNLDAETIHLDSIDVDLDFLAGFDLVSITPPAEDSMDIFGQRSWSFAESVSPGETLDVTFRLNATKQGHYVGDFDVCNPNQDFTTVIPNMDVLAE